MPARLPLANTGVPDGWQRWLLLRRSLRTRELAHYVCAGPRRPAADRAGAGGRDSLAGEVACQAGKQLCGLDQHQVRRWRSWYRWITLAMLAYAFLVVAAVTEHAQHPAPPGAGRVARQRDPAPVRHAGRRTGR
jgi:hypothetical protein